LALNLDNTQNAWPGVLSQIAWLRQLDVAIHARKYMSTTFEGLSVRQVRATIPKTLCLLHTEVGFMSVRSPISVDIKHKQYTGEYEIDCGVLYVFFEGRSKSSPITGPGPELLARLFLIELVFHAPSWHDHYQAAMTSRVDATSVAL